VRLHILDERTLNHEPLLRFLKLDLIFFSFPLVTTRPVVVVDDDATRITLIMLEHLTGLSLFLIHVTIGKD